MKWNREEFEEAAKIIATEKTCSVPMLQRKMRIGYKRGCEIMQQLADAGAVELSGDPLKPQKVLIGLINLPLITTPTKV